ncbi:MAG: flagellar biosynthesis anti-sigma factor FlgM [Zoogloeaceae bacterium]|jgi:negative regulator of flagellin synthesis FlgM|nr:flagellar biosynthesis anti-sigma factor FlgM [Zoogloeaceae bacterium]
MKVDTAYKFTPQPPLSQPAAKQTDSNKSGTQVELSSSAQVKASGAPVDQGRIAEIKAAIAEGRFRVNPEAIADSLIRTAQEMIAVERRV